jgi:hypothetical protein
MPHPLTKAAAVVIQVRHYLERRRQYVKQLLLKCGDICNMSRERPLRAASRFSATHLVCLLSHTHPHLSAAFWATCLIFPLLYRRYGMLC